MPKMSFNSTVAARTKFALAVLGNAPLLKKYLALGGLAADLEQIRDAGLAAEAANLAQANARRAGSGATIEVLQRFAQLQREYNAVMNVLLAVKGDLVVARAAPHLVSRVEHILINEAELSVKTARDEAGNKKRTTRRSASQEAIRAEIEKDAGELLGFAEIHKPLAARGVTAERVKNLQQAAAGLTARLAERSSTKGGAKASTEEERAAVERQTVRWSSSYRLFAAFGAEDPSVAALLKEAAR